MDSVQNLFPAIVVDGLAVETIPGMEVASLRYFEPGGSFAAEAHRIMGRALPGPLQASAGADAQGDPRLILAWRSPTETLVLSGDRIAFADLKRGLAKAADGCMVEQTGGLCAIRVGGRRSSDLLLRLGGSASIPRIGEARSSRLAELNVLTLSVESSVLILVVERVFLSHLLGWIQNTVAELLPQ